MYNIGMKMMLVVSMIMMVGCGSVQRTWADIEKEENAKKDKCRELGGIPRPGVQGGYSKDWVYGGCDFPPVRER